jgi:hypothetical protein
MSALDHPLTQSLLNLNPLNLLKHLRPEPLVLLLVLDMSELSSMSTRTTKGLLRDGVESTFDGLRDGVLVAEPCCFSGRGKGRSVGEGDLVEFHAESGETMTCELRQRNVMPLRGLPVDAGVDASHGHSQCCGEIECCLHDGNDGMVAKRHPSRYGGQHDAMI